MNRVSILPFRYKAIYLYNSQSPPAFLSPPSGVFRFRIARSAFLFPKVAILLWIFSLLSLSVSASANVDSQANVLRIRIDKAFDTAKVHRCVDLAEFYNIRNQVDSGMFYANMGLSISKNINYSIGIIKCLNRIGNSYGMMGNYSKAYETYFEVIRLSKAINYKRGIIAGYSNIGSTYLYRGDNRQAVTALLIALRELKNTNDYKNLTVTLNHLATAYLSLNLDSALIFCQKSFEMATKHKLKSLVAHSYLNLGQLHDTLRNYELAIGYFTSAAKILIEENALPDLSINYAAIGQVYMRQGKPETSIQYLRKGYNTALHCNYQYGIFFSSKILVSLYRGRNSDSTLKYMEQYLKAKDSIHSESQEEQLKNLEAAHQIWAQEKNRIEKQEEEDRLQMIQYTTILLFLVGFTLFSLIAYSSRMKRKTAKALGLFCILLFFELINLTIHSLLTKITDHNMALIFTLLVVAAIILLPLHQKMDQWLQNQFYKRQKKPGINPEIPKRRRNASQAS